MKKIIIITLLIIGTIQLTASVWQRVEGPTERKYTSLIFNFNNQIFASAKNSMFVVDEEGNWSKAEQAIFDSTEGVRVFYQNNNVALISGLNGKLYVTYDYGKIWTEVENIKNAMFGYESVLIVDETIFAQEYFVGTSLYKLERNSTTWEKVYFDNEKKDSIYAGKLVSDGNYIFAGDMDVNGMHKTGGGITVSSDKGNSWYKLDNFDRPVTNMVIHNEKLYVAASDNYIYRTSDKGNTWTVDTNLIMPTDHLLSFDGNLFAAVNNTASIYKADYGLLMSSDDGVTWQKRSEGLNHINYISLKATDSKLFVLTKYNTIFESTDNGIVWSQSRLYDKYVASQYLLFDNDTLYVSASFGLFFSTDNGISWKNKSTNLSSKFSRIRNLYKRGNVFVVDEQHGRTLYISTDGGEKWEYANITGEDQWIGTVFILEDKIVVTSNDEKTEMSYTTDYGVSWRVNDDPVFKKEYRFGELVRDDENNITVFTSGGILKSTNNGINWENVGETNPPNMGPMVVKDGIFYGLGSEYYIYTSIDKGFNWESTGYQMDEMASFIFDIIEDDWVVSINLGIKVSSDFGKTFRKYLLDTTAFKSKTRSFTNISQQGDYLIATNNEGIWRAKLSDLGIVKSSVKSEIERNYITLSSPYPQPARTGVSLDFDNTKYNFIESNITLFDITGRKLENQIIDINKNSIHWDCSSAQPGIYLINIKQGTKEKVVKVVVE